VIGIDAIRKLPRDHCIVCGEFHKVHEPSGHDCACRAKCLDDDIAGVIDALLAEVERLLRQNVDLQRDVLRLMAAPSPWKYEPSETLEGMTWQQAFHAEREANRGLRGEIDRLHAEAARHAENAAFVADIERSYPE